jgi:hypothetical protein
VNSWTGAPFLSKSPLSVAIQIGVWLGLVPTTATVIVPDLGAGTAGADSLAAGLAPALVGLALAVPDATAALAPGLPDTAGLAAALDDAAAGALEAGGLAVPPQALNTRHMPAKAARRETFMAHNTKPPARHAALPF